jgi:N-acetylmuramoyl-L-alanine amidase
MSTPRPRDRETRELISRLQARRARRRRLRIVEGTAVFLALAVLVIVAVALLASGPAEDPQASAVSLAGGGSTARSSVSTPSTSGPVTTTAAATSTGAPAPTTTTITTTTAKTTTTTKPPATTTAAPVPVKVVCIDPGHQAEADSGLEPVGPGATDMKAKVSSGTSGVVTGIPESEFNLAVGLKLRDALEARGIKVVMTRTSENVDISNSERAQIANKAGADLFVRIHADGNADSSVHGIHTLYPASIKGWTDDIAADSKEAALLVQRELIKATGAKDRGINPRSDLTGFNWSDVPVVLPELGYMTNPTEDKLLATDAYRDKIVQGLVRAIVQFLQLD